MAYNVFGATLNLALSIYLHISSPPPNIHCIPEIVWRHYLDDIESILFVAF